jgi:hypothetical protein
MEKTEKLGPRQQSGSTNSPQFKWALGLAFSNGVHTFCYAMTELRAALLKNGMTRKWAANVKDGSNSKMGRVLGTQSSLYTSMRVMGGRFLKRP